MQFQTPLLRATLVRRYKRFLADIRLADGSEVTAHCANPGAMTGLASAGATVWVTQNSDPKRKLRYSWKLVELPQGLACIDTALPNALVAEALDKGCIDPLAGYTTYRREVKYADNARIDFLLSGAGLPDCYVEVKAVSLARTGWAEFPDSVTKRGTKHLAALSQMRQAGFRAVMLYLLQRSDCDRFRIAGDIDPAYAAAFDTARECGVETLCYRTDIGLKGMFLDKPVPVDSAEQKWR